MKNSLLQHTKLQVSGIIQIAKSRRWKLIYAIAFLAGFLLFAVFGKTFVAESTLLDVDSLRGVKDAVVDKPAFLQYIFWRRMLWVAAGICIWWWNYGTLYIYGLLGCCGFVMGACLQTCIMRYSMKGVVLWIFLYFPQVIFYAGAFFCGMMLCTGVGKSKPDKIKFLWQNILLLILLACLYAIGIYGEGKLNVEILQSYLQYF